MIRNETEYQKAALHLSEQRKRLDKQHSQLAKIGLTRGQIKRAMDPMESFHLKLTGDVVNYEHDKKMKDFATVVEDMANEGYGVAWHDTHEEFRPFIVEGDTIIWWDDPSGCGNENFKEAVQATFEEMMRQLGP